MGSGLVAGVGLLAKENAVLFPLYTLALELTILRFKAESARTTRQLKWAYGAIVAIGLLGYFGLVVPRFGAPSDFANRDFTLYERAVTQFRVLPMYLGQMLVPLPDHMPFYYDNYPKSTGLFSPPTTALGAILLLSLLTAACALRSRAPVLALGIFWFFVPHALTSGAVNLELAFEHRNYFALLGFLLSVVGFMRHLQWKPSPEAAITGAAVAVLLVGALGWIRAATWGDPVVLAMDMAARNPTSSRASSDLGAIYARLATRDSSSLYVDFAMKEFQRGMSLPGASPLPEQGLILLAVAHGRPVQDAWWESLYTKLQTRPLGPQETMAVSGLIKERFEGLDLDDAKLARAYEILALRGGSTAEAYLGFANHAENYLHDEDLAERLYVAAMSSPTMTPRYAQQLLWALAADGKFRFFEAAARVARERHLVEDK
ncbi:hypothetical protein [Arenimonas daejeonensis]|uniref:hypothetical protein n=1 Tax=Arenimonas daejeonensis TaxID=370777 RepID=UPI0011BF2912|nr:hypothetical protein [Arenimonas daejeonensis]